MTPLLATANRNEIAVPRIENVLSLANRELFWTAKHVRASPSLEHIPFLFWLMADLQPKLAVTTGMTSGVAHFAICQAIERLGLEAACHGFGEWAGEGGDSPKRVPESLRDYSVEHYEESSQIRWSTAEAAADLFDEASIDLLFVGQKLSPALLDMLRDKWLPRISGRGVIVLGNLETGLTDTAVREQVSALRQTYPNFVFQHGGGLLLLLVGPDPTERLRILTATSIQTPGYRSVLQMFRRLGGHYAKELGLRRERARAKEATLKLEGAETELAALHEKQEILNRNLAELNAAYDERHQAAARLQAERQSYRNEALSAQAAKLETEEELARHQLRERDLEAALSDLETERSGLSARLAAGESEFDTLRTRLGEREHEAQQLREAIEASRQEQAAAAERLSAREVSLTGLSEAHEALRGEHEALCRQIEESREAEARLRADAEEARNQLAALAQEREALIEDNARRQQEVARLSQALDAREQAEAVLRNDSLCAVTERDARIAALEAESRDLAERLQAAAQAHAEERTQPRTADLAEREAQISKLAMADEERRREIAMLSQAIAERELAEAVLRNDNLCALIEKDARIAELEAGHARTLMARDDRMAELADQIEAVEAERDAAKNSLKARFNELKILTNNLMQQEGAAQLAQQEQQRLESELKSLRSNLARQTRELARVTTQRDKAESHRQALLSSTSWRVSAPVRTLGRLVRRMRGN